MRQVDVLFCARGDAERLFRLTGHVPSRAASLRAHFGVPVVALTAGPDGAVGCDADSVCTMPAMPVEATIERLGSGDAFAAGFLAEYLAGRSLESALRMGVAVAALKRTILGDMLNATRAEIEAVLAREGRAAWR